VETNINIWGVFAMSIFGTIMHKIFGGSPASAAPADAGAATPEAPAPGMTPAAPGSGASMPQVDVSAVLTDMAAKNGQGLNWQKSIVDLMKLLGLDSSLEQRKLMADELGYSGDTNDSATMNVWLHKQVMQKLAENGGMVPDSLKV
jgi:hypothetical protein